MKARGNYERHTHPWGARSNYANNPRFIFNLKCLTKLNKINYVEPSTIYVLHTVPESLKS